MKKENVFWGILLILASLGLVLNKLGFFVGINAFSIMVTIFLVGVIIKSIKSIEFGGILFPIAFICILYDDQLGITAITPWTVLIAAALGTAGLHMIFHKSHHERHRKLLTDGNVINGKADIDSSFGSTIKYIKSEEFEFTSVDLSFASAKIYFDNTPLKNGKGEIYLDLSFSGVELYVPRRWTVVDKTENSFSGVKENNLGEKTEENVLTLVGELSFSGVTINYI